MTQPDSKTGWGKARFLGVVTLFGVLACVASVAGLAGRVWWAFDLASHFRVQYALGLLAAAVVVAVMRRPRTAAVFAAVGALNLCLVVPLYLKPELDAPGGGAACRVLVANVRTENTSFELVERYIRETEPDIVVLIEVDDEWLAALQPVRELLPHCTSDARSDNFGIALYSRVAPRSARVERIGPASVRSIVAEFGDGDDRLTVIATHPVPPEGRLASGVRNAQLAELGRLVPTLGTPVVLVGDLNVTPWSHHYRQLLDATGLVSASRGHGVRATWPSFLPAPLRIPIDHCLRSKDVAVVSTRVGRDVGSDHRPLLVDLRVPGLGKP